MTMASIVMTQNSLFKKIEKKQYFLMIKWTKMRKDVCLCLMEGAVFKPLNLSVVCWKFNTLWESFGYCLMWTILAAS